jgi:hypothetical protein
VECKEERSDRSDRLFRVTGTVGMPNADSILLYREGPHNLPTVYQLRGYGRFRTFSATQDPNPRSNLIRPLQFLAKKLRSSVQSVHAYPVPSATSFVICELSPTRLTLMYCGSYGRTGTNTLVGKLYARQQRAALRYVTAPLVSSFICRAWQSCLKWNSAEGWWRCVLML